MPLVVFSLLPQTLPHWLFGQQDGPIRDRLDQGIHDLLIDTYYGFDVPSRVRPDLQSLPKRSIADQEIGAPATLARFLGTTSPTSRRYRRLRSGSRVAVDFYRRGDVFGVANALNGVSR